jgi:hypothetical protein
MLQDRFRVQDTGRSVCTSKRGSSPTLPPRTSCCKIKQDAGPVLIAQLIVMMLSQGTVSAKQGGTETLTIGAAQQVDQHRVGAPLVVRHRLQRRRHPPGAVRHPPAQPVPQVSTERCCKQGRCMPCRVVL